MSRPIGILFASQERPSQEYRPSTPPVLDLIAQWLQFEQDPYEAKACLERIKSSQPNNEKTLGKAKEMIDLFRKRQPTTKFNFWAEYRQLYG